ncbi:hypothetical protein NE599_04625 [[Clostridium] symbiosum]|uniref:hypothetical protein n=1 Tax=Clostridium symbiosum TaxID=1512 RepID=UPI00210BF0F6|nr:hypothetical protein [[Clostridium] symbiosum]MBS6218920.1 hypothetical protein [[Clostridium] symbiosum]MCQ4988310.1 hypothetical protein [[Clostridium] symbiosum]
MRLKLNYKGPVLMDFTFMIGYLCVLIAFLFTCTTYPNNYDWINTLTRNLRIVGYCFLVTKLLSNFVLKREHVALLAIAIITFFITVFVTDLIVLLTDILVILASAGIEFRKVIKLDFICRLIFLVFVLVSFYMGIIPEAIDYRNWVEIRHSFGFAHPNRLALHLLMMCLYSFYLSYGKRRSLSRLFFYVVTFYFTYAVTGGRTSCICILFIIFIDLILNSRFETVVTDFIVKRRKILSHFIIWGALASSFIAAILSAAGIIKYNGTTISSRAVLAGRALISYGLSIFGRKIETIGTLEAQRQGVVSNVVDNAFIYLLVNYGVIAFVIFIILIYASLKEINRRANFPAFICTCVIIISLIMEGQFVNIESNLFLLWSVYLFVPNKYGESS